MKSHLDNEYQFLLIILLLYFSLIPLFHFTTHTFNKRFEVNELTSTIYKIWFLGILGIFFFQITRRNKKNHDSHLVINLLKFFKIIFLFFIIINLNFIF